MQVTFTRSGARKYTTLIKRDDAVLIQVPSHDRPASMPHDLAHFMVERELQLRRGFWGCMAAGAMFPGMRVISGRLRPHAEARSQAVIKEAGQQLAEAEVLVSVLLDITRNSLEPDWPAVQKQLSAAWKPRRPTHRGSLGQSAVTRVCAALRAAENQWAALPLGQSLNYLWAAQPDKARRPVAR